MDELDFAMAYDPALYVMPEIEKRKKRKKRKKNPKNKIF